MGSLAYDFLLDSFLFDEDRLADEFRSVSDEELVKELRRYREHCVGNAGAMSDEVRLRTSLLKMVAPVGEVPVRLLKQASLYVEQFVIDDPLFGVGYQPTEDARVFSNFAGLGQFEVDREGVAQAVRTLKSLTPMIAADYVKVLPFSYLFEPPTKVPIHWPASIEDGPEAIRWLRQHATIHPVESSESGLRILPAKPNLAPREKIVVQFAGGIGGVRLYQYSSVQLDPARPIEDEQRLPIVIQRQRPSRRMFNAWVTQSVDRAAQDFYNECATQARIASDLQAAQMTGAPLEFELLQRAYGVRRNLQTDVANTLMRMELPFLGGLDNAAIMSVRQDYGESFANFRIELEKQLRGFGMMTDEAAIAAKVREVAHELGTVQVQHLRSELKSVTEKAIFAPAFTGIAGLALSALLGNLAPGIAGGMTALGQAVSAIAERRATRRKHPAFFLWEAMRRSGG